ncbi:MAG: hypothetical protein IM644_05830 [Phenylobacterium sp.]|uniref:hypothetical protein n=1 Tax=Phenylobacterium sp. TaxID=1871053 RepID=UPI0025E3C29E|nr:hypothetical protein [Phenylobacterium sp.]MCA6231790.1 hypothetical protein [Phenylobacterium sp.]MCA6331410.1 hypothetical protein [Phenylobacterium sp.]
MTLFRIFLVAALGVITVYTAVVVANHGLNLFPAFFGDMARMGWAGQFNLDFMFMLALSALWTAWRNGFSAGGLGLAVVAFFGGMPFLCIYLLYLLSRTGGDMRRVLLGDARA